jgi:Ca2+-binding RTX toxin-like protein
VNTTEVVIAPVGTSLRVNGFTCVDASGAPIDLTKVSKLVVNGTSGDDAVVLDTYLGSFGAKITGTGGGGVVLALGGGTMDRVGFRGISGADNVAAGSHTGRAFVDFTGDGVADLLWTSTAARRELMIATAGGNDSVSGSGRLLGATGTPLSATATLAGAALASGAIGALTSAYALSAFGGPGNDQIQGGDGNDRLDGGEGDDAFVTSASRDGADVFIGGLGTDTLSYAARTAALTVTLGLTSAADANDGESGENDDVTWTVEDVTGGSGNDALTGNGLGNVLRGGAGNDLLNGGPGGTCTADVDRLFGDAGDDTFEMNAANDCGDEVTGGDGKDLVTYRDRANALAVSRDDSANDGEANERDNVKGDVEVLVGGQGSDTLTGGTLAVKILGCGGDDVITGSSAADELSGGPGNDTVNGGAGSDTFLESGDEPLCYSAARGITVSMRGLGSDVLNGGAGVEDRVVYAARTAPLTVTLCVDTAAATGVGSCGAPRNDGEAGEADAVLNVEVVEAGQGSDSLTGAAADEWLYGGAGDDILDGGGGNDHLDGGSGTNTLTGGAGADICQNYGLATSCDLHVYTCDAGTKRDCDRQPGNACETDTATSATNCGACGNVCAAGPNGVSTCVNAQCAVGCSAGFGNCDGNLANGCEAAFAFDPYNCGACGTVCGQGFECTNGACVACAAASCVQLPQGACSGGDVDLSDPAYVVHVFRASGTLACGSAKSAEVLVVGGGGGGGGHGGGGGGGGIVHNASFAIGTGMHAVTVGAGGAASQGYGQSFSGQNSQLLTTIAYGGGAGGVLHDPGTAGGSGGGAARDTTAPGGAATKGVGGTTYGNRGGQGVGGSCSGGSGGGGAGAVGGNSQANPERGGAGGAGAPFSITGTLAYYGGGGAGGDECNDTVALGGLGGGGNGGGGSTRALPGTPNTGGGGGGEDNSHNGAPGGSGVVIIKYPR